MSRRRWQSLSCALMWSLLSVAAQAVELYQGEHSWVDLGGDLKTFTVGVYPYDHALMPKDPSAQGLLDARLKLDAGVGDLLRITVHHQLGLRSLSPLQVRFGGGAGGGVDTPQALDLSWAIEDGQGMRMDLRVDRALLTLTLPGLSLRLGRQPVSFGSTFFFTPLDLVAPFTPTTIDREYKPGIDALRADAYLGTSGTLTVLAAYGGAWSIDESMLFARMGTTLGAAELGLLAARTHGDLVLGLDLFVDLGGVPLRAEGSVTYPRHDDPFVRAALGSDHNFGKGLTLMGELYYQSIGASHARDYLDLARGDRFGRGELWAMGTSYAAASLSYELLPIIHLGFFSVVNLGDASALLGPSLSWSVADEVEVLAGGYAGLGARPAEPGPADLMSPSLPAGQGPPLSPDPATLLRPRSEFGLMPGVVFVEIKSYF